MQILRNEFVQAEECSFCVKKIGKITNFVHPLAPTYYTETYLRCWNSKTETEPSTNPSLANTRTVDDVLPTLWAVSSISGDLPVTIRICERNAVKFHTQGDQLILTHRIDGIVEYQRQFDGPLLSVWFYRSIRNCHSPGRPTNTPKCVHAATAVYPFVLRRRSDPWCTGSLSTVA